ncbi:MAG: AEC family transporter [Lachnospiraceae bacterium]|nr:AEC family transporter [Lachnospiraceae bacterium]
MESLFLAASVVVPLVVYMAVGGLIRKMGIFTVQNFKALNIMIFKIFIPLSLFFNVYDADLGEAVKPEIFIYVMICVLLVYSVAWMIISKCIPERADASTMIQGIYRSNFVLFGTTIALSLCGQNGIALNAAMSAIVVPLFNILSVILFEIKRGRKVQTTEIIINILKNPLVEAGILGCIFSILKIHIPELLFKPLENMSNIATPLALVTLGGMLSFGSMVRHRMYLVIVIIARLVVVPMITISVAIWMGMRGDVLVVLLAIFASPTAVASAPMAQAMGGNGDLAGEIVATTSVSCLFTIFLFIFSLSRMGLI